MKQVFLSLASATILLASCKKDQDPTIIINTGGSNTGPGASSGSELVQFNGLNPGDAGATAGNAVYLDFSTDKTTAVLRSSWDLGFYSGNDFRVILNNTSSAGAKVTTKYDLALVGTADTVGLTLQPSQTNPQASDLAYFDNANGDLTQTAIPAVSATDADNPVIILNRGQGGAIAARSWVKLRIFRNGNGYKVVYGGINDATFKTVLITKNDINHFQHLNFDGTGSLVAVEPEKAKWDIVWSYSVFQTNFGSGNVPYNFSDLIAVNYLSGVQVKEKIYADAAAANTAYLAFNKDSVNATSLIAGKWTIGSNWRSTQPATGAKQDRFYLVRDANGNYYKLKCLRMGVGTDGGTRGKPEFNTH